jgi:(R,R)-butanediol dehydrogenase/meso-butanediol dehydrogenase/diacetyl reductase
MKALVYYGNKNVRVENVDEPLMKDDLVKLKIDYCGICATDMEEYYFGPKYISHDEPHPISGKKTPIIVGHEVTGTVVEVGKDVLGLSLGTRVVLNGILSCGECYFCDRELTNQCAKAVIIAFGDDGGMAEYAVWKGSEVIPLPNNVKSIEAALVEPSAVAHHAVAKSMLNIGDSVAILGCGTVGLLALQIAKAKGAKVYAIDKRRKSLDMARQLGADGCIDANIEVNKRKRQLMELTAGIGPDVVIDAAGGHDTPVEAVELVRTGGTVVLVAIYTSKPEFDFNEIMFREVNVIGSLGYQRKDVEAVVSLISEQKIKTEMLVSEIIGIDQVVDVGYNKMLSGNKDFFRILVSPSQ